MINFYRSYSLLIQKKLVLNMQVLPADLIYYILDQISYLDIINLATTSKQLYDIIINNEAFWRNKFGRDFGPYQHPVESWKNLYRDTGNLICYNRPGMYQDLPFKIKNIAAYHDQVNIVDVNSNGWIVKTPEQDEDEEEDDNQGEDDDNQVEDDDNQGEDDEEDVQVENYDEETPSVEESDSLYRQFTDVSIMRENLLLTNDGHVYKKHLFDWELVPIRGKYIHSSYYNLAIIDLDNNLWISGSNYFGQLGLGSKISDGERFYRVPDLLVKSVFCSVSHVAAIDLDNHLWIWGSNDNGQLGFDRYSFESSGFDEPFVVATPRMVPDIRVKQVYCSDTSTAIIDLDDNIWVTGYNSQFQNIVGEISYNNFTKINNIKVKRILISRNNLAILDLDDKVTWYMPIFSNGTFKSTKVIDGNYKAVDMTISAQTPDAEFYSTPLYFTITLGYVETIEINDHLIFIINYVRLVEKLRNRQIRDYNILPELQQYAKNDKNTVVLFRDRDDKLMICEVNYQNNNFLAPRLTNN